MVDSGRNGQDVTVVWISFETELVIRQNFTSS